MPRHFITQLKYGNLQPWINCIDDTPPSDDLSGTGGGGGVDVVALQAQVKELQEANQAKDGIIQKLRPIERKWNTVAGGLSEQRLEELKIADQRLAELQQQQEQSALKIRQEVASEYDPKIQGLTKEKEQLTSRLQQTQLTYDIFREFNANGGIGSRFEAFTQLAGKNFERNKEGHLQIRDDAGQLLIYKDPDAKAGSELERVATPADFMKMLADGTIVKSNYQFNQLEMLQLTLEAHNKASGAGLPGNPGYNGTKPLQEMSQAELGKLAFKA